jgi:hypothetical protein
MLLKKGIKAGVADLINLYNKWLILLRANLLVNNLIIFIWVSYNFHCYLDHVR